MTLDNATQTQHAKAELERLGKPMPMDYHFDWIFLPELEVAPNPLLYRELVTEASKVSALEQGFAIHGAKVNGEPRYYTRRNLRAAK